MEHTYKIAGLTVNMDTFGFVGSIARPYEVEYTSAPDMTVENKWEKVKQMHPEVTDPFCEYTATAIVFYDKLLDFQGMLLHSSAVIMDGKAYLFTADSGTGKSTHTSLYRRYYGDDRVRILNDDKPALRLEDGEFFAYGTPWSGKTDLNLNLRVPLGGICVLERGEHNEIERLTGRKALKRLLPQTVNPNDNDKMEKLLDLMTALLEKVPVWIMKCNMDPDAARVSYEAMSGIGKGD